MMRVIGIEELKKNFSKYNLNAVKELFNAMQIGCDIVANAAREIVPVKTGRLRSSLGFNVKTKRGTIIGEIGTNVFYAPFVEFGTYKMKARPYLRPAFTKNIDKIMRALRNAMKRIK